MAAGVEEMRGCQQCWARLSTLCFWGCLQAGVSEHRWDGPATTLQAQPPGTHAYLHTGPFSQHRLRWRKVLVAQLESGGRDSSGTREAGGVISPCCSGYRPAGRDCLAEILLLNQPQASSWVAVAMSSPPLGKPPHPGELPQGTLKMNTGLSRADLTLAGNLMLPALHKCLTKIH